MKKIVLLFSTLILLLVSSCSSITPLSNARIGSQCFLRGDIIQAFNSNEALGKDNDMIVKLITSEDTFYDGKEFSGYYIMIDTYTYTTKQNIIKTVPVFIKASEYNAAKPLK